MKWVQFFFFFGAILYSHFRVEEMGWERSGDLPKLTLVVRADPSQCEHQRVYNEWVCPFHRIPLGCWIQTLIRLSLLTTFLKSHSRRIQSWGSSIQGGPCFKIQQRSDMEMENGSEGGDKAASRPLNQAVEGITVMITVQGTPQEEQVWGTVGRMNLKVRSVGTSRHSDVLQATGEWCGLHLCMGSYQHGDAAKARQWQDPPGRTQERRTPILSPRAFCQKGQVEAGGVIISRGRMEERGDIKEESPNWSHLYNPIN